MNLFKIETQNSGPVFFPNKDEAKDFRLEMQDGGAKNVVIMRGPDHRRGESFNKTVNTPKTRKSGRWS